MGGSSKLADKLSQYQEIFFYNLGGPLLCPLHYQVNLFKGATALWILALIHIFNNHSTGILLYLFLHGSYGLAWLLKYRYFPDPRGNRRGSLFSHLALSVLLIAYWMIPVPLAMGKGIDSPSLTRMLLLLGMYGVGLVLMMGSDYQKWRRLSLKKGLISDGFFARTRNPNYLGQFLIYSSFALCAGNFIGFVIFYGLGGSLFAFMIYLKQQTSFKQKEGWQQYSRQSYIFLPKILPTLWLNIALYSLILIPLISFLSQQSASDFYYPFA